MPFVLLAPRPHRYRSFARRSARTVGSTRGSTATSRPATASTYTPRRLARRTEIPDAAPHRLVPDAAMLVEQSNIKSSPGRAAQPRRRHRRAQDRRYYAAYLDAPRSTASKPRRCRSSSHDLRDRSRSDLSALWARGCAPTSIPERDQLRPRTFGVFAPRGCAAQSHMAICCRAARPAGPRFLSLRHAAMTGRDGYRPISARCWR